MPLEILDDFRPTAKSYYATKAYRLFWWSAAFFMIIVLLTIIFPPSGKEEEMIHLLSGLAFFISFFTGLVGLGYGIRSFINRKKKSCSGHWLEWLFLWVVKPLFFF